MQERSSHLSNYHELKFSREQGFFDRSFGLRLLIGFIFTLALFLFFHFKEARVEIPEVNSIAPNYLVAQEDFDFLDEEATAIQKQDAVREVGKIFQIHSKEIRQHRVEFENFLIYNQEWRSYVSSNAFEEMYRTADAIEKVMLQLRFTDRRTLEIMQQLKLSTDYTLVYTPTDLSTPIALPAQVWEYIQKKVEQIENFHSETLQFTLGYFQNSSWIIEDDVPAQRLLRKRIQSNIPDKYTHIYAGSRIIDQGERITSRHVAMLKAMKNAMNDGRNLWSPLTIAGNFILALMMTAICFVYFLVNFPKILSSNRQLTLIVTVTVLTLAIAKITELSLLNSTNSAVSLVRYPIFVVFPAILLCSLMNSSIATFVSGFLTIVLTIGLSFERQGFMIINLAAALVAILSTHSLRHRKEIFVVCVKSWLASVLVIFAINFAQNVFWSQTITADIITTGISLLLTAIAVVGLLPLLESTFKVMTDVSLTEYMDPNNDLLRRLSLECPGTYQHSIVVGNVAEAAAVAIGANGLFCRVATLYHDIGKMTTPQYFTENQQGGMNMHQLLTPQESAAVIIAHVSEGVSLARKAGLPEPFIDIIKEHHGTSLVYYFYRKQLEKVGGDKSKVDESEFRYAGPKPRSKESGIIMLADSLEAAARSLEKVDEQSLTELSKRIVKDKMEDGQFSHCLLTLEEMAIVMQTLVKTVLAFSHTRVKYPNREAVTPVPNFES